MVPAIGVFAAPVPHDPAANGARLGLIRSASKIDHQLTASLLARKAHMGFSQSLPEIVFFLRFLFQREEQEHIPFLAPVSYVMTPVP